MYLNTALKGWAWKKLLGSGKEEWINMDGSCLRSEDDEHVKRAWDLEVDDIRGKGRSIFDRKIW